MIDDDDIAHLLAIGDAQVQELMGVSSPARALGSDPREAGSTPAPPASFEAGTPGGADGP